MVEYIDNTYTLPYLKGYSGSFSPSLLEKIIQRPEVDFVEEDQVVYALRKHAPGSGGKRRKVRKHRRPRINPSLHPEQPEAPWGLARISHRSKKNLSLYKYPSSAGAGVDVYVIDTGINVSHPDFEGRAKWGITIPLDDLNVDGNGHGTHCAGTIASKTYGVAKKANVIAVKVLRTNGYGTNSDVLKGVEWTIKEARKSSRRAVANMSLGGGKSLALERMVNKATEDGGVHFAVAAGNDGEDACEYSPAGAEGPITVGATSREDYVTSFSNVGSCVDLFAPGLDITSTWTGGQVKTISGTSMASPHVAGILALYLGEDNWNPRELKRQLIEDASEGVIAGLDGGTVNFLANTKRMMKRTLQ